MSVRIGVALLLALLAHAGAYALILVTSPEKADIHIEGGSISISLLPTDLLTTDQAGTIGEETAEPDTDTPPERLPEERVEPAPQSMPKPTQEPISERMPKPIEPAPLPLPEPEDLAPEPDTELQPLPEAPKDPHVSNEPVSAAPVQQATSDSQIPHSGPPETEAFQSGEAQPPLGPSADKGAAAQDVSVSPQMVRPELGNAAIDNYNGALMRHMRQARKFDTNARRSSRIALTIDASGNLLEVKVLRTSGDKTWDRRVVRELKRIAPYPAPPAGTVHSWSFDAVPK